MLVGRVISTNITHSVLENAKFLTDELIDVLPLLYFVARKRSGSFLEVGAATGMDGTHTLVLERCFGWNGLLVEAQPRTYARLQQSPRTSAKMWAAACPDGEHIRITNSSNQRATTIISAKAKATSTTLVPCREIRTMMANEGLMRLHFASVDVQGAEIDSMLYRVYAVDGFIDSLQ